MWPPSSEDSLLACSTVAIAFQRMSERMRCSSSRSPGNGASSSGGIVLTYGVLSATSIGTPEARACSSTRSSSSCARSGPSWRTTASSASSHSCVSRASTSRAESIATVGNAMTRSVFEPVRTRRTFEEAAEQIAEKVRQGQLRVGDKLPGERALATQMEISRPTLREAVKVLVDAGLLAVRRGPGGGMFVASDVVPVELVRQRSPMRVGEVASVLEARRLLEPRVAQLAAVRATDDDFAALQRSIDAMAEILKAGYAPSDEDRFLQLDVQFHLALARAGGNPTVETLMRALFRQLEIARDMAMHAPAVPEWTIDIHERTLAAVRSGDLAEVEVVMDEHLAQLERTWEQESARALVRPLPAFLLPGSGKVP